MTGAPGVVAEGEGAGYLAVATVRRPHGIRGEIVLALETDRPSAVFRKGSRLRLGDSRGTPLERWLTVARTRPFKDGLLLMAEEFATRTPELEALRGHTLLIEAGDAAPADPDEVHYRDLVGMTVTAGGSDVGRITSVAETAGGELLVVQRPGRPELLLPFVREWVRTVDREGARLDIEAPEGLLDL